MSSRFLPSTACSPVSPSPLRVVGLLLAGLALCLGPDAQAQQPEPETVFDHLMEEGRLDRLPPTALERRPPATLTLEQRRRLRAHRQRRARGRLRSKAQSDGYRYVDPVQTTGAVAWTRPKLNTAPLRSPQRAGDVNGDGVNDWINVFRVANDRTASLSDRTSKTFLKFGGGGAFASSYYDQLYYRNLHPVGNFVGSDNADAIELLRGGYRILEGTSSGYTEVARKPALPARVSEIRMAPTDLDADGYDDVVLPAQSDSTITVLYGASTPSGVERRTYTPFFQTTRNHFSHATGNVDSTTSSDGEIVRVAGITDTTAAAPQDSLTITVLDVDSSRALTADTTFRAAPLADIQADIGFPVRASRFVTEIANVDGTGLQEIILREAAGRPAVYTTTAGGGTYDNTAVPFPTGAIDVGDLNGDGRADFFLPRDTAIALGPQTVSNGLSADAPVPQGSGETVSLFNFPGNRLGDLNGDGDDEIIAELETGTQFGARLLDYSGGAVNATDVTFDRTKYEGRDVIRTRNVGDWDGDGTDDVAFVYQDGRVELYFGDPTTALSPDLTLTGPAGFTGESASLADGDFTGNGQRNLAVGWRSDAQTVAVYEAGAGTSPVHTIGIQDLGISPNAPGIGASPQDDPLSTVTNVGDVNADGTDDLAVAVPNVDASTAQAAFLFLGRSSLSGTPDVTIDYSDDGASTRVGAEIEALGDIDDDGIEDFAVADHSRPVSTSQGSAQGGIYVHFGRSAGTPTFGAPDEIITPQPDAQGERLTFFPWSMTVGDFNDDGIPDLAASPAISENVSTGEALEAIYIYEGGSFFNGTPERELFVPGFLSPFVDTEFRATNFGGLATAPPASDSTGARLMVETYNPTNALVFTPYGPSSTRSPDEGLLLRAPDQSDGLGSGSIFVNLPHDFGAALGDFSGDGRLEALLPQPGNPNYLGSPAYTYQLGPVGGAAGPAQDQPVAVEKKDLALSETGEQSGGTAGFRAPRVELVFSGTATGEGRVTVGRFAGRPFEAVAVDQKSVSSYYVRVTQEQTDEFGQGGLSFGDSSQVRFDASALPGVSTPEAVTVYQRDLSDAGPFTALNTTYDAATGELVAQGAALGFGEFVFASDVDSLRAAVEVPRRLSVTAAADSVTVEWDASGDAAQYVVHRSASPIEWAPGPSAATAFDTTAASTTAFVDTSAQVGETYYYRVAALGSGGGTSGFSPQDSARPSFVLGSPSGDGAVTAGDASLVRRFSVGLTRFDRAQRLAGDVSGDGAVNAADASLIQQFVVDLINTFPADTSAKTTSTPLADVRGTVEWGSPTDGTDGRTRIPLRLGGEPSNVRSVQFTATYDTSSVEGARVKPSELPRGWRAAHHVDAETGTVRVALSGTTPLSSGRLAQIVVQRAPDAGPTELSGRAALYTAAETDVGTITLDGTPQQFRVEKNYPNPFGDKTTIQYALPTKTTVEVAVYDVLGRRVRTLVNERQEAGRHTATLEASSLSSGTYFYRVRTEEATETGRMVIVR